MQDARTDLQTDGTVKNVLPDETTLKGTTEAVEDGKMKLATDKLEKPSSFSLACVEAINPESVKTVIINARTNTSITSERGITKSDNYYHDGELVFPKFELFRPMIT